MKKAIAYTLIVGALATAIALKPTRHIAPDYLYPNPEYTPGKVATSDFKELTATTSCGTYSACHRKTTDTMKTFVCGKYPQNCDLEKEIDHFCPLALGCADDVKNLWAQPKVNMWEGENWGFQVKDRLEYFLVLQMKAGKISPKDAQNCILKDWVACYKEKINDSALGSFYAVDPDSVL